MIPKAKFARSPASTWQGNFLFTESNATPAAVLHSDTHASFPNLGSPQIVSNHRQNRQLFAFCLKGLKDTFVPKTEHAKSQYQFKMASYCIDFVPPRTQRRVRPSSVSIKHRYKQNAKSKNMQAHPIVFHSLHLNFV